MRIRIMWRQDFAILLLAIAGFGAGFTFSHANQAQAFITAPVSRGVIASLVNATGALQAQQTVEASSQLSGQVAKVFVNFNDVVKAGQPLAQLDQEPFVARVNEARAALKM